MAKLPPWFVTSIEIPIYCVDVVFVIAENLDPVDDFYKLGIKEDWGTSVNDCWATTKEGADKNGRTEIYMLFRPVGLEPDTIGHELMHCVSVFARSRGIVMDPYNDEPLAYVQGFIQGHIFKAIERYHNLGGAEKYKS